MMPDLSVDDILTTTRSVRKRLDFSRPVSRQVLLECLELAVQAPTAAHAPSGQWLFVGDPDKKKALGDIYRTIFNAYPPRQGISSRGASCMCAARYRAEETAVSWCSVAESSSARSGLGSC